MNFVQCDVLILHVCTSTSGGLPSSAPASSIFSCLYGLIGTHTTRLAGFPWCFLVLDRMTKASSSTKSSSIFDRFCKLPVTVSKRLLKVYIIWNMPPFSTFVWPLLPLHERILEMWLSRVAIRPYLTKSQKITRRCIQFDWTSGNVAFCMWIFARWWRAGAQEVWSGYGGMERATSVYR